MNKRFRASASTPEARLGSASTSAAPRGTTSARTIKLLRDAGAEEIHFTDLRESILILRNTSKWTKNCDSLLHEIEAFLRNWESERMAQDEADAISA